MRGAKALRKLTAVHIPDTAVVEMETIGCDVSFSVQVLSSHLHRIFSQLSSDVLHDILHHKDYGKGAWEDSDTNNHKFDILPDQSTLLDLKI